MIELKGKKETVDQAIAIRDRLLEDLAEQDGSNELVELVKLVKSHEIALTFLKSSVHGKIPCTELLQDFHSYFHSSGPIYEYESGA